MVEVGKGLEAGGARELDCSGLVLCPGLVDLHTHVREPGREDEETVETASAAGAIGGFTALCPMPNTEPPADSRAVVEMVWKRGREVGLVDLFPAGAVTRGREGRVLAPMGEMAASAAAVDFFTDDGSCVADAGVMRKALEYARGFGAVVGDHPQDPALAGSGQVNEGVVSTLLGLEPWPAEAEEVVVARDIALASLTGGRLHLQHLSTARSVELVAEAKARGLWVTAEVTPHHLCLTEEACLTLDPVYKVNPPLRGPEDVAALRRALASGTVDAIATDHAPHSREEKEVPFAEAPFGVAGLETALAALLTYLVEPGEVSLERVVEALTAGPARVRRLPGHGGPIAPGAPANLCLFDPSEIWVPEERHLASRSRNNPFLGRRLRGKVVHTLLRGRFTLRDGRLVG